MPISDPIISFGLRNGGPKNHQFNFAALFELIMSHILHKKHWVTLVQEVVIKIRK